MSVTIDARAVMQEYGKALRMLRTLPGFSVQETMRAEAGSILKAWAGRTQMANESRIILRAWHSAIHGINATRADNPGDVTVNTGEKGEQGLVWMKTDRTAKARARRKITSRPFSLAGRLGPGGRFVSVWKHFSAQDWGEISRRVLDTEAEIHSAVERHRKTRGFARQSVIQIADSLGIDLGSVKGGGVSAREVELARRALARDGKSYRNGVGTMTGDETKTTITLRNVLPYNSKIGMDRTLLAVIGGRAKHIEKAFAAGVSRSAKAVAKSFPELVRVSNLTTDSAPAAAA